MRVPTVALRTIRSDGTMASPSGWPIGNRSLAGIEGTVEPMGIAPDAGAKILSGRGNSHFQVDPDGPLCTPRASLQLRSDESVACTWPLESETTAWGTLGAEALQSILADGGGTCTVDLVTLTFERA